MEESNMVYFLCAFVLLFSISVYLFAVMSGAMTSLQNDVQNLKERVRNEQSWQKTLKLQGEKFDKYDRFLKWNSMLDTSYRTNGMVCAFRYKGDRKIEFCRYNPEHKSLPLEVYDYPGTCSINERMFDSWLPCIGGVAPVGESTIPQFDADAGVSPSDVYSEDGWVDTPSHDSCPAG